MKNVIIIIIIRFYVYFISMIVIDSMPMQLVSDSKVICRSIKALYLDCDGTIADTEKDLTLTQFNEAFKATPGLEHIEWNYLEYGRLLQVGASQARFTHYFNQHGWPSGIKTDEEKIVFADVMKRRKDDMFDAVWTSRDIPVLPGILRIIDQAIEHHVSFNILLIISLTFHSRFISSIILNLSLVIYIYIYICICICITFSLFLLNSSILCFLKGENCSM